MTEATKENLFVGAIVIKGKKSYHVYKVNSATFWAGEIDSENVMNQWKHKPKGMKWVDLMKRNNAIKLNYVNSFIDPKSEENRGKFVDVPPFAEDWLAGENRSTTNRALEKRSS